MCAETFNTVVSAGSAIVAVASAILAHRAKVQTRRDLFNAERNALVLAMVDNDTRCEHIALQEAFAKEELARIEPRLETQDARDEYAKWLTRIPNAAQIARGLALRQYSPQSLDSLDYDEVGLATLRQITRGEQANSKLLASPTYDLIFSGVSAFVARHERCS